MQKRKAFTLVELIVVITIIAILGTIGFISLQNYSKDARDSKRITDISSLLSKLNVESAKGISFLNMLSGATSHTVKINNEGKKAFTGTIDFGVIKENRKSFLDPKSNEDYLFGVTKGNTIYGGREVSYNFIQGKTIDEVKNKDIYIGNYFKYSNNDSNNLFEVEKNDDEGNTYYGISIWKDPNTGFIWEGEPTTNTYKWSLSSSSTEPVWDGIKYIYPEGKTEDDYPAFKYCANLGEKWRLPSKNELISIINVKKPNVVSNYDKLLESKYLSSTTLNINNEQIWYIDFQNGAFYHYNKNHEYNVLCINENSPKINYINNPDASFGERFNNIIIDGVNSYYDKFISKYWQADISNDYYQWSKDNSYPEPIWNGNDYNYPEGRTKDDYPIFNYCTSLGNGWRVPTISELLKLSTYETKNINDAYSSHPGMKGILETKYFFQSSSEFLKSPVSSWYVVFNDGHAGAQGKDIHYSVVCIHD